VGHDRFSRNVAYALATLLFGAGCFDPAASAGDLAADTTGGTAASSEGSALGESESESSGGESEGEASSSGAASEAGDQAEACATYCEVIGDHCDGTLAQYSGALVCEATCGVMDLGSPEDALGNTVGCRTFHAMLAAEDPDTHCRHAGPAGDGTCGANCENFCTLALEVCTGDLAAYPDADTCIAECGAYAAEPPYTSDAAPADTFACRMHHVTLAAAQPEVHCAHIGPISPVCTD
jgi:hypothetical protein